MFPLGDRNFYFEHTYFFWYFSSFKVTCRILQKIAYTRFPGTSHLGKFVKIILAI